MLSFGTKFPAKRVLSTYAFATGPLLGKSVTSLRYVYRLGGAVERFPVPVIVKCVISLK